jgi:hypothetical protein
MGDRKHFLLTASAVGTSTYISNKLGSMKTGLRGIITDYSEKGCKISHGGICPRINSGKQTTGNMTVRMTVKGNYAGLEEDIKNLGYSVTTL